jgi:hypothetical protein
MLAAARARWIDGILSATLIEAMEDWPFFLDAIRNHSVLPLIYETLSPHASLVPAEQWTKLKQLHYHAAARAAALTGELLELAGLFDDSRLRFMAFKGPALALQGYGAVTRRRFDDLDFLVHPDDLSTARGIVLARGYNHHLTMDDRLARCAARTGWDLVFQRGDGMSIELDTGIAPHHMAFNPSFESLCKSAEVLDIDGHPVEVPAIETQLLLLCVHGAKHGWNRLLWILDLIALIRNCAGINWKALLSTASDHGARRMVLLGLSLAEDLVPGTVPQDVAQAFEQDAALLRLRAMVGRRLTTPGLHPHEHLLSFRLACRERLRDRLRHCILLAVTPSYADWRSFDVPDNLFFIYYFTRPFRLIGRMLRR